MTTVRIFNEGGWKNSATIKTASPEPFIQTLLFFMTKLNVLIDGYPSFRAYECIKLHCNKITGTDKKEVTYGSKNMNTNR